MKIDKAGRLRNLASWTLLFLIPRMTLATVEFTHWCDRRSGCHVEAHAVVWSEASKESFRSAGQMHASCAVTGQQNMEASDTQRRRSHTAELGMPRFWALCLAIHDCWTMHQGRGCRGGVFNVRALGKLLLETLSIFVCVVLSVVRTSCVSRVIVADHLRWVQ